MDDEMSLRCENEDAGGGTIAEPATAQGSITANLQTPYMPTRQLTPKIELPTESQKMDMACALWTSLWLAALDMPPQHMAANILTF